MKVLIICLTILNFRWPIKSPNFVRFQGNRARYASMQISRNACREGGVALCKNRQKIISLSLSSDRCTVALDTPLIKVELHDNEFLGKSTIRRETKKGKVRSHDRKDFRRRSRKTSKLSRLIPLKVYLLDPNSSLCAFVLPTRLL